MFIAFDTETTGVNPAYHEAIEIGASVLDSKTHMPTGNVFQRKLKIEHPERVEPGVLGKFNHYDEAVWAREAVPQAQAWQELSDWFFQIGGNGVTRVILVGCNLPRFDHPLAEHWFSQFGLRANMSYHSEDIIAQYALVCRRRREKVGKSSQKEIAAFWGIDNPKAHSALADCMTAGLCFAVGEAYLDAMIDVGILDHVTLLNEAWYRIGHPRIANYQPLTRR